MATAARARSTIDAASALPANGVAAARPAEAVAVAPALASTPVDLAQIELTLAAWRLRVADQFDELLCLPHLTGVARFDYQVETVLKVLRGLRGRALLADEVGLGKTVEAGMVIKEMLLRGAARRVLILVPSALVGQWTEELRAKFGVDARSTEDGQVRSDGALWRGPGVVVASMHWAKLERNAPAVAQEAWDLVVVDEAHHVKNRTTAGWRLVNQLQSRHLLLLTATPVETDLEELYNLITLLKPGQLATPAEFKRRFVDPHDPLAPLNRDALRALLGEVMVRNTRARAGLVVELPPRFARTVIVPPHEREAALYAAVLAIVRRPGVRSQSARFLLEAAGSSPHAVLHALRGELGELADDVRAPAEAAAGAWSKAGALAEILAEDRGKAVVFTRFGATLDALAEVLRGRGIAFARFAGGMSAAEKDEAVARFRDEVPVLLATEVGGEGRNLQFANVVINVDLPWNPMKIEQRIGRVHRIGQTREVHVVSLCGAGTAEDRILDVLDRRIRMFELVVGELDMILGRTPGDRSFDDRVFDIYRDALDDTAVAARFDELAEEMAEARHGYQRVKQVDDALFAEDFET
jgi:SNF2 family DNA or RNA helicase